MNKDIHIPLVELLSDPDTKHWIDNIIGVLTDYKLADNTVEKTTGNMEIDFKSAEHGLVQMDLEVQLLEQTEEATIVKISTRVLGIDSVQEEVYVEVSNEELMTLSSSPFTPLNFKPLAQGKG